MNTTARLVQPDRLGDWVWDLMCDWKSPLVTEGLHRAEEEETDWDRRSLASLGRDVFQMLFQWQPEIVNPPPAGRERISSLMACVLASPGLEELRDRTCNDEVQAMVAWSSFFPNLLRALQKLPPPCEEGCRAGNRIPGLSTDKTGEGIHKAVARAVRAGEKACKRFACAWGDEHSDFHDLPPKQKLELASRLAAEPILLQIMELAGNWFGDALQQRRQRQRDGTPDGIEFGRDLPRMLGSELATLADPDLEDLWLHRYSTRTLQQYRQGSTPCKRGPVVVCVDTSGSMDEFEVASKALAIAAAKLAQRDRRPVRVILFSCDIEIYDAPQPMAGAPWLEFLAKVAHSFSGGGTDFDLPLEAALETITSHELYRRADLVFITDGDCEVSYEVEKLLANEKKKRGFGLYTIFLDRAGCESLEALSDEVWTALDSESGLELLAGVA